MAYFLVNLKKKMSNFVSINLANLIDIFIDTLKIMNRTRLGVVRHTKWKKVDAPYRTKDKLYMKRKNIVFYLFIGISFAGIKLVTYLSW